MVKKRKKIKYPKWIKRKEHKLLYKNLDSKGRRLLTLHAKKKLKKRK